MEILLSVILGIILGIVILVGSFIFIDIFSSAKINGRNKIRSYIKYIKTLFFIKRSNIIGCYKVRNSMASEDMYFFIELGGLHKFITTTRYGTIIVQDIDIPNEKSEIYNLYLNTICPFKKYFITDLELKFKDYIYEKDCVDIENLIEAEKVLSDLLKSERRNLKLKDILNGTHLS
jgi:hypothetical protein